jgi:hypothetical protein
VRRVEQDRPARRRQPGLDIRRREAEPALRAERNGRHPRAGCPDHALVGRIVRVRDQHLVAGPDKPCITA